MLLINGAITMFIIVFTRIIIVATIINIIFTKIGGILSHLKYYKILGVDLNKMICSISR